MKCPRCHEQMVPGKVIESYDFLGFTIVPRAKINHATLKVVDCLKCPICGHSDDNKPEINYEKP